MGNNNKKKVIVTGATGFIGQNLIPYLIEKGYEITAISRNPQKAVDFDWFSKVDFIQKDISQHHEEVEIGENTGLFHLAWEGLPHYNSAHHYEENLPNNYNYKITNGFIDKLDIRSLWSYFFDVVIYFFPLLY